MMDLGLIESKLDSNLYFKVEGRRPLMLVLYDDDLFLDFYNKAFNCYTNTWRITIYRWNNIGFGLMVVWGN